MLLQLKELLAIADQTGRLQDIDPQVRVHQGLTYLIATSLFESSDACHQAD